jgi:hypothetical protein
MLQLADMRLKSLEKMEKIMKISKFYAMLVVISCILSTTFASSRPSHSIISVSLNSLTLVHGMYPIKFEVFSSKTDDEVLWLNETYSDTTLVPVFDGRISYYPLQVPTAALRGLSEVWYEASYLGVLIAPRTQAIVEEAPTSVLLETDAVGIEIGLNAEDVNILSDKTGIGTTTPTEVVEVLGNVKATSFYGVGTPLTQIYNLDANDGSPANALYVDNNGWVGIGTTAPNTNLQVAGEVRFGSCTTCNSSTEGTNRYNTTTKLIEYCNGSTWVAYGASGSIKPGQCMYRWGPWSCYTEWYGWFHGNGSTELSGGIAPSNWSDNGYRAYQMSASKDVLCALFNQKGYCKNNSLIYARHYRSYSSTDARFVGACFRIKNNNTSASSWTMYWYFSCYGSWTNYASVALNGSELYVNTSNCNTSSSASFTVSIPANRTSTLILVSSGCYMCGCCQYPWGIVLAVYNNSLQLPSGCEYVDDLDVASDGWSY